jgi:hypothetical protein
MNGTEFANSHNFLVENLVFSAKNSGDSVQGPDQILLRGTRTENGLNASRAPGLDWDLILRQRLAVLGSTKKAEVEFFCLLLPLIFYSRSSVH